MTDTGRTTVTSLALAGSIITAWLTVHVGTLLSWPWHPGSAWMVPLVVALQTWLGVGLFIVAHDAMHRSLAPGHPGWCDAVGTVALLLYAGFAYRRFRREHLDHHRAPGTASDPDFHRQGAVAAGFWRWFGHFLRHYVGVREVAGIATIAVVWIGVVGVDVSGVLVLWALPAVLSSLQLFRYGTYLPHRPTGVPFEDDHRSHRGTEPGWYTLATCFHFGVHHEHHLAPSVPWWRLPASHRRRVRPTGPT